MLALLLFLLIPWSPFPPTVVALQWLLDISTISTSCRLSRPWKALLIPTCMRTTHCSEGESFSWVFTEPPSDVFCFLGAKGLLGAPQHTALFSPTSQTEPQLTIPMLPSEMELSWHNLHLRQQTSTHSDICKDNHRNYFIQKLLHIFISVLGERKRQVSGFSLQILFQDSNCCIIHILVFTCLPSAPTTLLNSL